MPMPVFPHKGDIQVFIELMHDKRINEWTINKSHNLLCPLEGSLSHSSWYISYILFSLQTSDIFSSTAHPPAYHMLHGEHRDQTQVCHLPTTSPIIQ